MSSEQTPRPIMASLEAEYRRYRGLAERTFDQLDDELLVRKPSPESNSVATLVWHVSGNLESRFTNFLTEDGEKPWRAREEEFGDRVVSVSEARAKWSKGWQVLSATLGELTDDDLSRTVTIRGVDFTVCEALHRSLAHTASHVGQITYIGKMLRGEAWAYLSIAPGETAAYNRNPTREKG